MPVRLTSLLVYSAEEIRGIEESVSRRTKAILSPLGKRFMFSADSGEADDGITVIKPAWAKGRERWKLVEFDAAPMSLPIGISDVSSLQSALDTLQAEIDGLVGGGGAGEVFTAQNKDVVTIKAGQPVAIHSSGTGVVLADATSPGKEAAGLATADIGVGFSGIILVDGPMTLADWTEATGGVTLAARATYFLDTTAGKLSTTPPTLPGNILQICAKEISSDTLEIQIRDQILL